MSKYTYNIHFNDTENSNDKGLNSSFDYCMNYIQNYNGTDVSYFKDYKGGEVSIVCNETEEVIYSEPIY